MSDMSCENNNNDNRHTLEMISQEEDAKPHTFQQRAIEGRGITFSYGRNKQTAILKGVDINVNKGAIYGLLGPSGCGKTTLLKCLIGRLKPHDGSIQIYGKSPGDPSLCIPGRGIGYMPQELALYSDITVNETLIYFGRLYSMGKQRLKARIRFLLDFLEIPRKNAAVKNLSGGQKRRVSFACALIHQPPLLVLDEPTVGVDPLLRFSIWEHLKELATHNHTTIIITTHYVEEARKAENVALMRNGHILAEKNPEILIQHFKVSTLEDVFRKLCQKDSSESIKKDKNAWFSPVKSSLNSYVGNGSMEYEEMRLMKYDATLDQVKVINGTSAALLPKFDNMHCGENTSLNGFSEYTMKTRALISKSFTCLRRNKLFALFQIFVPALQVILFCLSVGHEPFDLKFAIVNNETNIFGYTQVFLDTISNRTLRQIDYDSLPQALNAVKQGEAWGAMYIGPKFSAAMTDRILEGSNTDNETIHDSTVRLYLDFSNQQIAYTVYARILEGFQIFAKEMLEKLYQNPYLAEPPIKIEAAVYGTEKPSFSEFMAPGVAISLTHLFAMGLTLLSIVIEKKEGLLDRCWVAGVSAGEMISAIMSALFVSMIAQIVLILIFAIFILNLNVIGSPFWLFVCLMLSGISGMAFGLLISTICNTEVEAVFCALGTFYPIFLISGMIWPVEGMPYYLRYISYCLPLTILGDTTRSVVLRGWGITEYNVWIGCVIPLAWTIVFTVVACAILKVRLTK